MRKYLHELNDSNADTPSLSDISDMQVDRLDHLVNCQRQAQMQIH